MKTTDSDVWVLIFITVLAGSHCGAPDAILSNKSFYVNYLITKGLPTTSDHVPVVITVSARPIKIPIRERFSLAQADWASYHQKCDEYTLPNLAGAGRDEIDAAVYGVTAFLS